MICYYLEIWDLRCKDSVNIFFIIYFLFYFLFISTKTCSKTITETNLNLNFIFIFLTKYIFIFSIFIFLYRNTHQTQNFLHYWNITSNPFSKKYCDLTSTTSLGNEKEFNLEDNAKEFDNNLDFNYYKKNLKIIYVFYKNPKCFLFFSLKTFGIQTFFIPFELILLWPNW